MGWIIAVAVIAGIIFLIYRSGKKSREKLLAQNKLIEDAINAHTELGNYKRYCKSQGTVLILSENGYVAYFLNGEFVRLEIKDVKSVKFIAQPLEKNLKKVVNYAGSISYRLEVSDFNEPIIDLPFGIYKDNADKLAQTTEFAEVKSTFDYIKKNTDKPVS